MGLSDQERLKGMYWSIYRLNNIKNELDRCSDSLGQIERLQNLLKQLWHSFIGKDSNGIHWFMGSSAANFIEGDPKSPWSIAVSYHLQKASLIEEDEVEMEYPFSALDRRIEILLSNSYDGVQCSNVYKTFEEIETLAYYLRRYDDVFARNYEEVSKLISEISGECFRLFANNDDYAKAYIINQMMHIIYGPTYPYGEDDLVVQIMKDHSFHHDFGDLMKMGLKELVPHHIELVQHQTKAQLSEHKPWPTNEELLRYRLSKVFEFCKSIRKYEHIAKSVLEKVEKSPLKNEVPKLKKQLATLVKKHKSQEQKEKQVSLCNRKENVLAAYGDYRKFELIEDFLKEESKKDFVAEKPTKRKATPKKKPVKKKAIRKKAK